MDSAFVAVEQTALLYALINESVAEGSRGCIARPHVVEDEDISVTLKRDHDAMVLLDQCFVVRALGHSLCNPEVCICEHGRGGEVGDCRVLSDGALEVEGGTGRRDVFAWHLHFIHEAENQF